MYEKEILAQATNMEFGLYGPAIPVVDTSATPMEAIVFWVLSDNTRIASITLNGVVITSLSAIDLGKNTPIYGRITSVTLSQGAGIGYAGTNVTG
jgi:hypothetical protein